MKKKVLVGLLGGIAICILIAGIIISMPKTQDTKAAIIDNFEKMSEELSPLTLTSSNPYDYVDNQYYDNIVNLGVDAIDPLNEIIESGEVSALEQYVATIALQEITECDLNQATGEDWETVEQFLNRWEKTVMEMPNTFEQIQNNEKLSWKEKETEFKKYGIFAKAYAKEALKDNFEFGGKKMTKTKDKDLQKALKEMAKDVKDKDYKKVLKYVDKQCK